jgi:hypothetical protein
VWYRFWCACPNWGWSDDTTGAYGQSIRYVTVRNAYTILVESPKGWNHLGHLENDGRILLKWFLEKYDVLLCCFHKSRGMSRLVVSIVYSCQSEYKFHIENEQCFWHMSVKKVKFLFKGRNYRQISYNVFWSYRCVLRILQNFWGERISYLWWNCLIKSGQRIVQSNWDLACITMESSTESLISKLDVDFVCRGNFIDVSECARARARAPVYLFSTLSNLISCITILTSVVETGLLNTRCNLPNISEKIM